MRRDTGYFVLNETSSLIILSSLTQIWLSLKVLCTATIGKPGETQSVDVLSRKSFRVDYDFPPFCTNHIIDIFSRRWREIGDGMFHSFTALSFNMSPNSFQYPFVFFYVW